MDALGKIAFRRERITSLAALAAEWRALEALARPSFFGSWHWIGALLAVLPDDKRPHLLRASTSGRTVALALLGTAVTPRWRGLIRTRCFHINETGDPVLDAITIEHNGLLTSVDIEVPVVDALLAWFATLDSEADELCCAGSIRRWPESAVERRGLCRVERAVPSYSVDLAQLEEGGELDPILSANARQQLRRARRQYERSGPLQLTPAGTTREALAFFAEMKTLHCQSWERRGRSHAFAGHFFEPFHQMLITRSHPAGVVELMRASAGDRTLGYLYNFRFGDRVYAYQSGFADAGPHEHPGLVSHALAIAHAYKSGMRVYDFMAGQNRLKERFATRRDVMLWQVARQPRIAFRIENVVRYVAGLVKI